MKITDIALKRPVAVTVLVVATFAAGLFSLTQLDVNYLPDVSYPMVKIHIWWSGATADDIENNIADPLEEVIATVDNLDYIESSSIEGMYTLLANFSYGVDVEVAFQDVVAAMGRVTKKLPRDMDPPVIIKADPSQLPVIEVMLTSDEHDLVWLREWADNWLIDRLASVQGTAGAEVVGGMEREIRVHLDPERLQAYKLSPSQVAKALYEGNLETFAGRVTIEPREIIARTMGEFENLEEIRDIVVARDSNGEEVYIRNVARVEDSHAEMRINTHFNGKPCVEFKVLKQYAANAVTVAEGVKARLEELRNSGDIPADIEFGYVEDDGLYVRNSVNSVRDSAILSAILVVIVVYLFLGRWRQVVVMMVALPVTLLINFGVMKAANFSINVFSLGGLVVALGVILDNSIVVMENITRLKSDGVKDYAHRGTEEVGSAIVAATLTFLAIFLPFVFVPGMVAELLSELVFVVGGVVVVSLLIALTLTPLLTDRLLRSEKSGRTSTIARIFDHVIGFGIRSYERLLGGCLRLKWLVVALTLIIFTISIWLASRSGTEFLPKLDDGRVMVKLMMPAGSSLAEVDRILTRVDNQIGDLPEVQSTFRLSGGRIFGLYTLEVSNEGKLDIQLVPRSRRDITTEEFVKKIKPLVAKVQSQEPGAKLPVKQRPIKGLRKVGEQDVEVNIKGSDVVMLYEFSEKLASQLTKTPGLSGVNISMDMTKPEYRVHIDRARASAMGVSVDQVAATLRTLVHGIVSTQYREGTEYYPIRVMVPEISLTSKKHLENLIMETRNGEPIYLRDIAEVRRAVGPVELSREDQVIRVIVRADPAGVSVGEALARAEQVAVDLEPPSGVEISMGGEARFIQESRRVVGLIIGFATLFAYVILAIQYESFVLPFLIILNVPLALTGALIALLMAGEPVGVTVQIGILVMMGGITSQGVVLLTLAEQYRQAGMAPLEAIRKAAPTRVRPILMTQLTTVLGLVPLAMNLGEEGGMLVTMAIAVIGGLLYSLLLTLLFLPAAYGMVRGSTVRSEAV
ncbi:Efflux pump membrane transporter BepE [Limihaloglobus sulfuriphilus]|uniref:Efflux pump membrane transporter BepE n=1 Tax=Limihaloglobus sulfuriphilus TaxID=1851148 RepID=A0A1R7T5U3_9BACT|nr:efflux RND transporter permease subunit [Limihaloglobus sulfuriphilus]AQQ71783.1 Efflux pump membrane transporter BepE [Limihaloglobus sulfuriphilus]